MPETSISIFPSPATTKVRDLPAHTIAFAAPDLSGNERKYLNECIDTGWVTHGGRFEPEFEAAFARKFGAPSITASSGTAALHLALLSLGIGPGDEVLVPALTFGATAAVVVAVGATPVLVEVDAGTLGMDHNGAARAITPRTRAILPVHLYGEDAGDFRDFGIPVIEDACESLGLVPIRGQMAAYSFYGNKMITTGEGGMLCGDFGNARIWRDGGFDRNYNNLLPGLNYRMCNLQAALGLAQLERFDELLSRRLANAKAYRDVLPGLGRWLFVVATPDAKRLADGLQAAGVATRRVFTPLHLSPAFARYRRGDYPCAEMAWRHGLCLPTGPHVDAEGVRYVVEQVKRIDDHHGTQHLRGPQNRPD